MKITVFHNHQTHATQPVWPEAYDWSLRVLSGAHLLCTMVNAEDQQEGDKIEASKQILCQSNIQPPVRNIIKCSENVHKSCWVPENTQTHTHTPQIF